MLERINYKKREKESTDGRLVQMKKTLLPRKTNNIKS